MYNQCMEWLTGGRAGEAKRLVLQLNDPVKSAHAAQSLVLMGAEAVPGLIEALLSTDAALVQPAEQALVHIGRPGLGLLSKALNEDHPIIRAHVAEVLGAMKYEEALPALSNALRGGFYTVRPQAALALGQIGDPQAVPGLTIALKDSESDVRAAAALALASMNDPRTFEVIGDLLFDDPQMEVRQAVARALGGTRRAEAIPYLMDSLRDSFWWYERDQAVLDLLGAIAGFGRAVVPNLIEALSDKEGTVRKFAAMLLARLPDERALEPLSISLYDTHPDVCKASAEALAAIGAPALPILLDALQHPEAWIRQQAVMGLTKTHDAQVVPALLNLLGDESREVRKQAVESLGQLQDMRALPSLQGLAASRTDREMAALARRAIQSIQPA